MANKYHDELATVIVEKIMEARNYNEYYNVVHELSALGHAFKFANGRSRMESDLKKFMKENELYYSESGISDIMQSLSERIGKHVHFRTLSLFWCLESKLIKEIQNTIDPWDTAKIIYSLGLLYNDNQENITRVINTIKDEKQRRITTICARIYFKSFEEIFEFFRLGTEI